MKFSINFNYREQYLPNKRCRKARERIAWSDLDVEVREIANSEDFPVAFIVHDMATVYEGAKDYSDIADNRIEGEYKAYANEIRTFGGRFFTPIRVSYGAAISTCFEDYGYAKVIITHFARKWYDYSKCDAETFATENNIIVKSDIEERCEHILDKANKYILFNGIVWEEQGEPIYKIVTFGLGRNHGGTGFFASYCKNPASILDNKWYFNALDREQALASACRIAESRGDTNDVKRFSDDYSFHNIDVIMPEMVTRTAKIV